MIYHCEISHQLSRLSTHIIEEKIKIFETNSKSEIVHLYVFVHLQPFIVILLSRTTIFC